MGFLPNLWGDLHSVQTPEQLFRIRHSIPRRLLKESQILFASGDEQVMDFEAQALRAPRVLVLRIR